MNVFTHLLPVVFLRKASLPLRVELLRDLDLGERITAAAAAAAAFSTCLSDLLKLSGRVRANDETNLALGGSRGGCKTNSPERGEDGHFATPHRARLIAQRHLLCVSPR